MAIPALTPNLREFEGFVTRPAVNRLMLTGQGKTGCVMIEGQHL
jgi:hypothetical protein